MTYLQVKAGGAKPKPYTVFYNEQKIVSDDPEGRDFSVGWYYRSEPTAEPLGPFDCFSRLCIDIEDGEIFQIVSVGLGDSNDRPLPRAAVEAILSSAIHQLQELRRTYKKP